MMRSLDGMTRPSDLIDKLEIGAIANGRTMTPRQCAELWDWIETIEDELLEARNAIRTMRGQTRLDPTASPEELGDDFYEVSA
jgi:hypothetical protein